jgi:hypothetical protein
VLTSLCLWHGVSEHDREVEVAVVLVPAASDLELVALGLGRVAEERTLLGLQKVLGETPGGKKRGKCVTGCGISRSLKGTGGHTWGRKEGKCVTGCGISPSQKGTGEDTWGEEKR